MCRRGAEILRGDILLDAIGAAIEAALAPAGEIEHGFAQGLGRDGAGVDRNAADAPPLLDDQHVLFSLAACTAARRPAGPEPMTMRSNCSIMLPPLAERVFDGGR